MNQSIEINIEKLVLQGFSSADRHKIGEALKSELVKLIFENGMPSGSSTGKNISQLNGGSFNVSKSMNARDIGNHIAKSIYGGMVK